MVVFESDDSPEATTSRAAGITRNVDGIDTRGAAKNGFKNPDLSAFLKFELGEDVPVDLSLWSWMNVKSLNRKIYPKFSLAVVENFGHFRAISKM